jgi:hypothetical protein
VFTLPAKTKAATGDCCWIPHAYITPSITLFISQKKFGVESQMVSHSLCSALLLTRAQMAA